MIVFHLYETFPKYLEISFLDISFRLFKQIMPKNHACEESSQNVLKC